MSKVVQLQYKMSASGDFARRLHEAYVSAGICSSVLSLYSDIPSGKNLASLGTIQHLKSRLNNHLQAIYTGKIKKERGLFSYPLFGTDVSQVSSVQNADIIILHWVLHGFMSIKNIRQLAKTGKPIIIIMHDMWSITGGCHYSGDCTNYTSDCSECPMFESGDKRKLAASGFKLKRKLYSDFENLHFISPSSWLAECANQSALTKDKPIYHIPNLLNHDIYKPHNKQLSREILNIEPKQIVLAFGAVAIDSPYKGWTYLMKALELLGDRISSDDVTLLIFGGTSDSTQLDNIPFNIKNMGRVMSEVEMSIIYNTSDVFIAPSLNDNLPYTIFESLACATPVVAFDTGGIPDMVIHKKNGYLAKYKDSEDLANGILYTIQNNLKGFVPSDLDHDKVMKQHLRLFDNLEKTSK
ncbi:MAG: glycosyltransferase [Saprospiraceae bacterium]|nr:glycosyltransferase [Saprospiraceae bacterium]